MSKEVLFGSEARTRIKKGIDKAAEAVKPTLGAVGMSAIIEYKGLDPIEADDGVTILKNLEFKDKYEQLGLDKIRKGAVRTSQQGGDGTATTTVLTQALVESAFKEITDSSKIREVRERLEKGLEEVLFELAKSKQDITEADVERIATISSLDPEVAKVIAEVIKDVGVDGVISVEKGPQLGYSKEVVKGARFGSGLISPYFINDVQTQSTILEDAYIVLVDRKISTNEQILNLLKSIGTGKDILILADSVDSVALATLGFNAQNKIANIAAVANPYSASRAREFLFDMAALTGATVVSEESGMKLDTTGVEVCGRADKIIVTKDSTTIIGGRPRDDLSIRVESIKSDIESTNSEYEKNILEERLAQLTSGIGVIRVGAYTDTEFNTKKYKFENAINATQAALQEGVVAGGGTALAKLTIKEPMFRNVIIAPLKQMAINAGMEWHTVVAEVQNSEGGYDFVSKKNVDMFEAGIIDPYKVTRLALESAVAIAKNLVSIDVAIVNEEEKKDE